MGTVDAMIIEHRGHRPQIAPSAVIAPTAVICGNVRIGDNVCILHGAVITAEDGEVVIDDHVVIMENAVIKGRASHPCHIHSNVLIGPHVHLNGCVVETEAYLATGASVFPDAVIGQGSEVRNNAVIQVHTKLAPQSVVPIGWVAVGDPAQLHSPGEHEEFWQVQRDVDVPGTVYGLSSNTNMSDVMQRQVEFYQAHGDDTIVER